MHEIKQEQKETNTTEFINWREEKASRLIQHILDQHHEFTKKVLIDVHDPMFEFVKMNYEKHGIELMKVHRLFGNLKMELEQSLLKEEEKLFPLILEYEATMDDDLITELEELVQDAEEGHDIVGEIFDELAEVTNNFQAPAGSSEIYHSIYSKLMKLEKNYLRHIFLESNMLFPKLFGEE